MPDTHVTIVGNLTEDPEVSFTPNGAAVTNFRLAVTARVKDGEGWRDGDTSFYRITAWRGLAEHIGDSLAKGNRVIVLGQLRPRSWETPEGGAPDRGRGPGRGGRPLAQVGDGQARARHQRQAQQGRVQRRPALLTWRAVRPGRMRPVQASRTTKSVRRPSDAHAILPDPATDPDTSGRPALRLAPAARLVDRLVSGLRP
jgi:single stranded DNA-binding protein